MGPDDWGEMKTVLMNDDLTNGGRWSMEAAAAAATGKVA